MASFSSGVMITTSALRVWEVFTDLERWPAWTSSMLRLEKLGPGPPGVGMRVRIEQPKLAPGVWMITEWNPGRGFTWVSRHPGLRVIAEHLVEEVSAGCRVTLTARFEGPLGSVAALLTGRLTRRYMALEAAGLRHQCEGAGPHQATSPV